MVLPRFFRSSKTLEATDRAESDALHKKGSKHNASKSHEFTKSPNLKSSSLPNGVSKAPFELPYRKVTADCASARYAPCDQDEPTSQSGSGVPEERENDSTRSTPEITPPPSRPTSGKLGQTRGVGPSGNDPVSHSSPSEATVRSGRAKSDPGAVGASPNASAGLHPEQFFAIDSVVISVSGVLGKNSPSLIRSDSRAASSSDMEALIAKLNGGPGEERAAAVSTIRNLVRSHHENRALVKESGGIPALIDLMESEESLESEHAVAAILNMSLEDSLKAPLIHAGVAKSLVKVLESGPEGVRGSAAAAIYSLGQVEESCNLFFELGAVEHLLKLTESEYGRDRKDALLALFSLSGSAPDRHVIVEQGGVPVLLGFFSAEDGDDKASLEEKAIAVLVNLAKCDEGLVEIYENSGVGHLCDMLEEGTARVKEEALSILLLLACHSEEYCKDIRDNIVVSSLNPLMHKGSTRTRTKAAQLSDKIRLH